MQLFPAQLKALPDGAINVINRQLTKVLGRELGIPWPVATAAPIEICEVLRLGLPVSAGLYFPKSSSISSSVGGSASTSAPAFISIIENA